MKCPDINRLIDVAGGAPPDTELEAHLSSCSSCRADLGLLQEIQALFRPEEEVPEHLVQRVLATLDSEEAALEKRRMNVPQAALSGVLGAMTTFAVLVVTGSTGTENPADMVLFSLGLGLAASLVQIRMRRQIGLAPKGA